MTSLRDLRPGDPFTIVCGDSTVYHVMDIDTVRYQGAVNMLNLSYRRERDKGLFILCVIPSRGYLVGLCPDLQVLPLDNG